MISILSITTAIYFLSQSSHAQPTFVCGDGEFEGPIAAGESITIPLDIEDGGRFSLTICSDATTVDFTAQVLDEDGDVVATCSGDATCQPGDPDTTCFVSSGDDDFEGSLVVTENGDPAAAGDINVALECNLAEISTTDSSSSDSSSSDSTGSPSSDSGSDSDDSGSDSDDDGDSDSSDSSATDAPSLDSDSSVVEVGELLNDASADAGFDANGRRADAYEAAGNAGNGMPFWQWIWVVVAFFVLINLGVCYWIRKVQLEKRKNRVSFDATIGDVVVEAETA